MDQPEEGQPMFEEADLIHRYTRADALRDGVLIDVSETAWEAGIRWPVALTAAAWAKCATVPPGVAWQDEAGRLWDMLWLLRCATGCTQEPHESPAFVDQVVHGAFGAVTTWLPVWGCGFGQKWRKSQAAQVSASPHGCQCCMMVPAVASADTHNSMLDTTL